MNNKKINKHNFEILNEKDDSQNDRCNCKDESRYPLNRDCLINNIIYMATIKNGNEKIYVGASKLDWKNRWHILSFNNNIFQWYHFIQTCLTYENFAC